MACCLRSSTINHQPLALILQSDRPFFGICLGLQLLFEGSEESGGCEGLGIIPGMVARFDASHGLPIPHIGWNTLDLTRPNPVLSGNDAARRVYFVHSFRAMPSDANADWVAATSAYGDRFVAAVNRGNIYATQFHPEKSGDAGLSILGAFLGDSERTASNAAASTSAAASQSNGVPRGLAKRVIACLDVRANDAGDLVVTKGDQYDVRESDAEGGDGDVRNLGKPVDLATRYFEQGADEVTFLNITGFRDFPLGDLPMLEVLRRTSEGVFVPLTVGGGIRDFVDGTGRQYRYACTGRGYTQPCRLQTYCIVHTYVCLYTCSMQNTLATTHGLSLQHHTNHSALEVAGEYFRSGADKVSIGSDAVDAAERYYADGKVGRGDSSIEQISSVYGAQAVVVSIDPRRVWVADPAACPHETVESASTGPNGERFCWWQCTVKGGREGRPLGAVELARAVEALGAGEILLNCIDCDGVGQVLTMGDDVIRVVSGYGS